MKKTLSFLAVLSVFSASPALAETQCWTRGAMRLEGELSFPKSICIDQATLQIAPFSTRIKIAGQPISGDFDVYKEKTVDGRIQASAVILTKHQPMFIGESSGRIRLFMEMDASGKLLSLTGIKGESSYYVDPMHPSRNDFDEDVAFHKESDSPATGDFRCYAFNRAYAAYKGALFVMPRRFGTILKVSGEVATSAGTLPAGVYRADVRTAGLMRQMSVDISEFIPNNDGQGEGTWLILSAQEEHLVPSSSDYPATLRIHQRQDSSIGRMLLDQKMICTVLD